MPGSDIKYFCVSPNHNNVTANVPEPSENVNVQGTTDLILYS